MVSPCAGGIELDQDLDFERREWVVQRIGWVVMALILVAALLGLFGGPGPLSSAVLEGGGLAPIKVEYERLARVDHQTTLTVRFVADAGDQAAIWMDSRYHESMLIEHIDPLPDRVVTHEDRIEYLFDVAEGGAPMVLVFHLKCQRAGSVHNRIGRDGGAALSLTHFVYP